MSFFHDRRQVIRVIFLGLMDRGQAMEVGGDTDKTIVWFKAKNPLLGDVSPRDMIRLGRYARLRRFIISAMTSQTPTTTAKAVH